MRTTRQTLSNAVILGVVVVVLGVAGSCNVATAGNPHRFVDNGDGTITDKQTGLMWEKKTGNVVSDVVCSTPYTCPDPTNVNNVYNWSSSSTGNPDGTLFTDFLAKMNCTVLEWSGTCGTSDPTTGKVTSYRDWRIPTIAELRTILTAESPNCSSSPCIDPIFGPTASWYWSSTSEANSTAWAWEFDFGSGVRAENIKTYNGGFARAVRGGP